jgi:hypothetical protein
VPVSLAGVKAVVPDGLPSLCPGLVQVTIAPPVAVQGLRIEDVDRLAEEVRQIVIRNCELVDGEPPGAAA